MTDNDLSLTVDRVGTGLLRQLYETMATIRRVEERLGDYVETNEIKTPCHLYIGQEAVAAGVCAALDQRDYAWGGHRSHGHYLAKGGDLDAMVAEVFGKATGCSGGRGGSMHLMAKQVGILGTVPIVAATVPLAVGSALASKLRGSGEVSVAFFGDGAVEEGHVHESLNLAGLQRLPVIFVIENNLYSSHMHLGERRRLDNLETTGAFHGIPGSRIDGNDVEAVSLAAKAAVDRARSGEGATVIECRTFRWRGHVGHRSDMDVGVKRRDELKDWLPLCPLARARARLTARGVASSELEALDARAKRRVEDAIDFAKRSPYPEPDALTDHVYAAEEPEMRTLDYAAAIREAHAQLLASDPRVFVIGQGLWSPWYAGSSLKDIDKEFGRSRVIDSPVSENATTGAAIGAAMAGMRPIVFHPRMDFMMLAVDPIVNQAANWSYVFCGRVPVPIVVRSVIARGGEQGAQHSQAVHAFYMHVPGLKVVMPSTPYDAKGLLIAASRDGNPIMYIDERWLYEETGEVPTEMYEVPIGKAVVRAAGTDVTIVGSSFMAREAVRAGEQLRSRGISAEVIDLRSLKPWDRPAVLASVRKTGRLVVADSGWLTAGAAAEIAATVSCEAFEHLRAPIERVCLPDCPAPVSATQERAYYRSADDIVAAAERTCAFKRAAASAAIA